MKQKVSPVLKIILILLIFIFVSIVAIGTIFIITAPKKDDLILQAIEADQIAEGNTVRLYEYREYNKVVKSIDKNEEWTKGTYYLASILNDDSEFIFYIVAIKDGTVVYCEEVDYDN